MKNKFTSSVMLIILCGCNPAYHSNAAQAGEAPAGWDYAYAETDKACGICEKKHKAHYAIIKCKLAAMDKYLSSYFPNKPVYEDYKTKRLLIAIRQDKKEITKDEADVLSADIYNKMIFAQNATNAEIGAQNASAQQAQAQQQNIIYQKMLGAVAQPLNAQRAWVDQQNQQNHSIHCYSSGNTTDCRQY